MKPARRNVLKCAALAAGLAAVPWAAPQARRRIPGPSPDAPGACKVVEGPINPKGWCIVWVKKS